MLPHRLPTALRAVLLLAVCAALGSPAHALTLDAVRITLGARKGHSLEVKGRFGASPSMAPKPSC
jgi:hypothetical protein